MSHYPLSDIYKILHYFKSLDPEEEDIPPRDLIASLDEALEELKDNPDNIVSTEYWDKLLILKLKKNVPEIEVVSIHYRDFLHIWELHTEGNLPLYREMETFSEIEFHNGTHRFKSEYLHPTVERVLNIHYVEY